MTLYKCRRDPEVEANIKAAEQAACSSKHGCCESGQIQTAVRRTKRGPDGVAQLSSISAAARLPSLLSATSRQ
jgi:hypothetical protein